ncbi:MAG: nucleotidyltransferase domain-containing protein [Planctomycetes bacterium]|nr:nucleotidyltransferase domain-containing protein [Planctomycetota bacterium]
MSDAPLEPQPRPALDADALRSLCEAENITLVLLFGSHAKGRATTESDIDLGIWLAGPIDTPRRERVWEAFMRLLGTSKVDVIFLNQAPPLLAWQAATEGKMLYQARPDAFQRFLLFAARRHFDSQKLYRRRHDYVQHMLERILS